MPELAYLAYVILFTAAAAGCLVGAWQARGISPPGVRRGMVGLLVTSGLWALAHVGVLLSPSLGLKTAFYEAGLIVGFATVWPWLWLCSAYSGRGLHRRQAVRWGALAVFVVVTVAKLTNPWHGLYFSTDLVAGPFPYLRIDHHVIYWLTSSLTYVLAAVGFFMLVEPLRRIQTSTRQLVALFGLTALPLAANAIGYTTPLLLDLSHEPIGVAAFALGALFVYRSRFEATSRAGRRKTPALVTSEDGRLRTYNEAATDAFPALGPASIGERLETVLPEVAAVLAGAAPTGAEGPGEERRKTVQVGTDSSDEEESDEEEAARYFRPAESSFGPGGGRLVVLTDVTEEVLRRRASYRKREKRLRQQKALLEQTQRLAGAWEVDLRTGEMSWSEKVYEIHEVDPSTEVSVEEALAFYAPEAQPEARDAFEECTREGTPYDLELPILTAEGARRWVRAVGAPIEDPNGDIVKVAGALQDVTERERGRRRLERYREYTSRMLDTIDDLFFVLDETGRFKRWNRQFSEVTGYTDEAIGRMRAADFVPEEHREQVETEIERVLATGDGQVEAPLLLNDGSTVPYEFVGDRIEDPSGNPRIVVVGRDISERLERERELERQNDLFGKAQEIAKVGAWEYDVQNEESMLTEQVYRIHGLAPDGDLTPERSLDFYHPDDRPGVRAAFRGAVDEGVPYDLEARLVTEEGEEKWVRTRGEPRREDGRPQGTVTRVRGTIQDITGRKEEERRREQVIRRGTEAIEEVDSEWRYTFVNETALALYDMSEEELLGSSLWEVFSGLRDTSFEEAVREAMRTRESTQLEAYYPDLDRWLDVRVYPNEDGGLAFYFEDVTERKRRERRLEALFEDSPDMIDVHGGDGTVLQANPRFFEKTGYTEENLNALKVWELDETLGPEDARRLWTEMDVGDRRRVEGRYRRNDGSTFPVEVHIRRLQLEGEDQFMAISHDITERRRRQRKLRDERDRLKTLFEGLPTPVVRCVIQEDGTQISDANEAFEDVFGVEAAAAEGQDPNELVVPEEKRREGSELDRRALEAPQEREVRRLAADGTRDFRLQVAGRRREDGPPEVYAIYTDVTEQKRRERALEETNATLEAVLANLPHGVLVEDEARRIITANEGLCETLGAPVGPTALEGRHADVVAEITEAASGPDRFADRIEKTLDRREPVSGEEIRLTDGRILERDFVPYQLSGEDAALWLYRDVTERKVREQTLRRRRQAVESLYEATSRLLTAERPQAVSNRIHEVLEEILDHPFVHVGLLDGGVVVPQKTAAEERSQEPRIGPQPTSDDPIVDWALRAGEAVVIEDTVILGDDIDYGSLSSLSSIPIGARGAIVLGKERAEAFDQFDLRMTETMARYAALVLERLAREEALREAKEEAQGAAELKTSMLANMSHEIRTPLTPVIGFAESLVEDLEGPEARVAERIRRSSQRLKQTLDSVLRLAQLEAGTYDLDRGRLDLRTVVREAADRAHPTAEEKGLTLETDLPDRPVWGQLSEGGIRRVVENLLENAVKFTAEGGQVEVRLHREDQTAVLEVEDTGIGIEEEAQADIFDAFEQESKGLGREYEGTGLGLSVVKRLAEAHGGSVGLESEKGEGSCFTVRLPAAGGAEKPTPTETER